MRKWIGTREHGDVNVDKVVRVVRQKLGKNWETILVLEDGTQCVAYSDAFTLEEGCLAPAVPGWVQLDPAGDSAWDDPIVAWFVDHYHAVPVTLLEGITTGAILAPDGKVYDLNKEATYQTRDKWWEEHKKTQGED